MSILEPQQVLNQNEMKKQRKATLQVRNESEMNANIFKCLYARTYYRQIDLILSSKLATLIKDSRTVLKWNHTHQQTFIINSRSWLLWKKLFRQICTFSTIYIEMRKNSFFAICLLQVEIVQNKLSQPHLSLFYHCRLGFLPLIEIKLYSQQHILSY